MSDGRWDQSGDPADVWGRSVEGYTETLVVVTVEADGEELLLPSSDDDPLSTPPRCCIFDIVMFDCWRPDAGAPSPSSGSLSSGIAQRPASRSVSSGTSSFDESGLVGGLVRVASLERALDPLEDGGSG